MTLELDISEDFGQVVDGLSSVFVNGVGVANALRRAVRSREAANSNGKYLTSDTVFHLDWNEHEDRPEIGGTIVDDDGDWTILEAAWQTLKNRWRCVCRQLYLDPAFTVTIQRPTFAKGETGAQEPTYATLSSDVVARIQIDSEQAGAEHELMSATKQVSVFFLSQQALKPGDRIIGPSGEVVKVLSWNGFDSITQFFTAVGEISKWPQS